MSATTGFALFKDGVRVSKVHSTHDAVLVEAIELGAVVRFGRWMRLADGYKVKEA